MNVNVVNAETGTVTYVDTLAPGGLEKLHRAMGGYAADPKPPTGPVEADPDEVDPEDGEDGDDSEGDEVGFDEDEVA